ncbi:general stress protein, partial [Singulisphaera rosea]
GAGIGAASGGLLGALIGSGIPEHEAEHFASALEEGHILVSVDVENDLVVSVRRIFEEEGSRRTHSTYA